MANSVESRGHRIVSRTDGDPGSAPLVWVAGFSRRIVDRWLQGIGSSEVVRFGRPFLDRCRP